MTPSLTPRQPLQLMFSEESVEKNLVDLGLADLDAPISSSSPTVESGMSSSAQNDQMTARKVEDEFLSNMSHELRTPLNAVLGMSEVLRDGYLGTLTDEQLEAVRMIHRSGTHLLEIINNLLDLSMIDSKRLRLDTSFVKLDELCRSCIGVIESIAAERNIRVIFAANSESVEVEVDERRMSQSILALLSNAVKFSEDGGEVGLELHGDTKNARIRITVWDGGIGIPAKDQQRIFDPFVQLDVGATRSHEGSGLGLAMAKKIVELHGGAIRVQSDIGVGSRFTIELPWPEQVNGPVSAHRELGGGAPRVSMQRSSSTNRLILIADDSHSSVHTVRSYLEAKGYAIAVADNGNDVLAFLETQTPAAILMDVKLPGIDGLEAMRRIRANPAYAHVLIIALTAQAMPGDRERGLLAGANAYMTKPIALKSLGTLLEEMLAPAAITSNGPIGGR